MIRLVRAYLRPYRGEAALVLVLQTVQAVANLFLPNFNADIINSGVATGDVGHIWRVGGLMLLISLAQLVANVGAVFWGSRVAMRVGRDLRAATFAQVETFSSREVAQFGAATLITRAVNDVQQVQMVVLFTFTLIVAAPIMLVGGVILALQQDLALSWSIVIIVPVLGIIAAIFVTGMGPNFQRMQKRIDKINDVLREQITGIRVIRAFVREDSERRRFEQANRQLYDTTVTVGRFMTLIFPIVMLVMNLSSVAIMWFGGRRVASGAMQIGSLTAFLAYVMYILMAVMMASMMFMMVPRAQVSARRIQ